MSLLTPAEIEQIKHQATWCNQLATATAVAGCVNPLVAATLLGFGPSNGGLYFSIFISASALAYLVHSLGKALLGEIV